MSRADGAGGRQCRICRNKDPPDGDLLSVGCNCFAAVHLACAVKAAQTTEAKWMTCPKCEHRWSGELDRGLLEAAPKPPEQEVRTCRSCLREATEDNKLLGCGCACRSIAAKPIHLACAVKQAQAELRAWCFCATCKHRWGGDLKPQLARARCHAFADRPDHDSERLSADIDLSRTLRLQGNVEEALRIGSVAFRVYTDGRQAQYSKQLEAEAAAGAAGTHPEEP